MKYEYLVILAIIITISIVIAMFKLYIKAMYEKEIDKTKPYYDEYDNTWKIKLTDRNECGSFEYIVGEYLLSTGAKQCGLIFHFEINGEKEHEHEFKDVIIELLQLESGDTFSIKEYIEDEYSKQEVNMIKQLCEKLKIEFIE